MAYVPPHRTNANEKKAVPCFFNDKKRFDTPRPQDIVTEKLGALQVDDFPALPVKRITSVAPPPKSRVTYAALASNWAEQVKENEEKAKKIEEEKRIVKKVSELKVIPVRQSLVAKKKTDSDDEVQIDIGCHVSDQSERSDPSDPEEDIVDEEEDEEPEEDPDAFWTQRKHKNDIY
jgi:hypothetical protein